MHYERPFCIENESGLKTIDAVDPNADSSVYDGFGEGGLVHAYVQFVIGGPVI